MTEAQWNDALTCVDFTGLGSGLQWLVLNGNPVITARKVQLYQVGCALRILHLVPVDLVHRAVQLAERAADHPDGVLVNVPLPIYQEICEQLDDYGPPPDFSPKPARDRLTDAALNLAASLAYPEQTSAQARYVNGYTGTVIEAAGEDFTATESHAQITLLKCVFGNPFRPAAVDPGWLTSTVMALARGIYDDRAFDRLPILADALQDAGCDHADVLDHCRGPGPHARGCWVVDLILGKT